MSWSCKGIFLLVKFVSSALLVNFTEISVVRRTEISVVHFITENSVRLNTEISVKLTSKADETNLCLWTLITLSNLSKRWTFYVFDSFGFGLKPFSICRWRRPVFIFPQLFDHDFILSQISLCTNNQEWYIWTMMGDFRYPLWKKEFLIEKG